jgi:predicted nucleic-acid-binding Zn-ribbon protein
MLNDIAWKSSMPNFTQIGYEIWKVRLQHHLCPYCQYVDFYETHASSTTFVKNYTEFHKNATINM